MEGSYIDPIGTAPNHASHTTWLDTGKLPLPRLAAASMQGDVPRTYLIELIGRKTRCPTGLGYYYHAPNTVVADRIISAKLLTK